MSETTSGVITVDDLWLHLGLLREQGLGESPAVIDVDGERQRLLSVNVMAAKGGRRAVILSSEDVPLVDVRPDVGVHVADAGKMVDAGEQKVATDV